MGIIRVRASSRARAHIRRSSDSARAARKRNKGTTLQRAASLRDRLLDLPEMRRTTPGRRQTSLFKRLEVADFRIRRGY